MIEDEFFAGEDDGNCEEIDVKAAVLCWKNAFPDPDSVEQCEILSIEEGDPSETIIKRVDFEVIQALPYSWIYDLYNTDITMSIWLTSLSLPYIPFLLLSRSLMCNYNISQMALLNMKKQEAS